MRIFFFASVKANALDIVIGKRGISTNNILRNYWTTINSWLTRFVPKLSFGHLHNYKHFDKYLSIVQIAEFAVLLAWFCIDKWKWSLLDSNDIMMTLSLVAFLFQAVTKKVSDLFPNLPLISYWLLNIVKKLLIQIDVKDSKLFLKKLWKNGNVNFGIL